jgi:hypothetical protein
MKASAPGVAVLEGAFQMVREDAVLLDHAREGSQKIGATALCPSGTLRMTASANATGRERSDSNGRLCKH